MNGIVVIGESVVDRVVSAAGLTIARPGGSPANVAVGLGRLGDAVTLITELGDDPDGDLIRAHLADSNVTLIQQTVPKTSTAAAIISDNGNAAYEFEISWTLRRELVPPATNLVHVGSLGTLMVPGAQAVTEILDALPPHVVISYDPTSGTSSRSRRRRSRRSRQSPGGPTSSGRAKTISRRSTPAGRSPRQPRTGWPLGPNSSL